MERFSISAPKSKAAACLYRLCRRMENYPVMSKYIFYPAEIISAGNYFLSGILKTGISE